MNRNAKLPYILIALVVAVSTSILALATWNHGTTIIPSDSLVYIRTGIILQQYHTLAISVYDPLTDMIFLDPATHYPPVHSTLYALGAALNITISHISTIISLVGWVALLTGITALTYRLSNSLWMAVIAVVVAAITRAYWYLAQVVMSEIIFLPLLVWTMVILIDLPQRQYQHQHQRTRHLVLASMLLALLPMTRYSGVVIVAGVIFWWVWHWWYSTPRQVATLSKDLAILSLSALPMTIWVIHNLTVSSKPVSDHMLPEGTFQSGIEALFTQSIQFFLPSSRFDYLSYIGGLEVAIVFYVLLLVVGVGFFWQYRPHTSYQFPNPPRSPFWVSLLFYVLLYTVLQPFFLFLPLDMRDMTTILCLVVPWLLARLAHTQAPARITYGFVGTLLIFNIVLMFAAPLMRGIPDWLTLFPPRIESVANRQLPRLAKYLGYGFVSWLVVESDRAADLENYHPALHTWLRDQPHDTVILTNEPLLFAAYPYPDTISYLDGLHPRQLHPQHITETPAMSWLNHGACTSRHHVAVVISEWDRHLADAPMLYRQIEQKCPGLAVYQFEHSRVYMLDKP